MLKAALVIAALLSAVVVVGIVGYSAHQQKQEFRKVQEELDEIKGAAEINSAKAAFLNEQLTNSQTRIEALLKEKEAVTREQKKMETQMRSALEDKEVTISELQGRLTVNIVDRVLFDSGQADLKPEGEQVLAQIAGVLAEHLNRQIYVIGHTDNVPIRASAFSRYSNNWELSTARATAAVRFLSEKAGVDPSRLAAVGYGEYHPIADNSTAEGRARNRRIAIVIMPENFNPLESPENAAEGTNQVEITEAPGAESETDDPVVQPQPAVEPAVPREVVSPNEASGFDTNKIEEIERKLRELRQRREQP